MFQAKVVYLEITTMCTLACKLCIAKIPYYKSHEHVEFKYIKKDIEKLFEVYDYIEKLDISGGEPLLYPNLSEVLNEALKYKNKIGKIRLITNGTILPSGDVIDVMKANSKMELVLDDYGKLSSKKIEILELAQNNDIHIRYNCYTGDKQFCEGFIDLGKFNDRNYNKETLQAIYDKCHNANYMCLALKKGKLYQCIHSLVACELGYCTFDDTLECDLYDDSLTIAEKRNILSKYGTRPVKACQRCNGFDSENGKRFPAADQIIK